MGYVVSNGTLVQSEDFDLIEDYSKINKTRVISAELWPFQSLPIGQLCVRWKNGAIGWFVASDFKGMRDYLDSLKWPVKAFSRGLPYAGGLLLLTDDSEEGHAHNTAKVTRRREVAPDTVTVVRRTRART